MDEYRRALELPCTTRTVQPKEKVTAVSIRIRKELEEEYQLKEHQHQPLSPLTSLPPRHICTRYLPLTPPHPPSPPYQPTPLKAKPTDSKAHVRHHRLAATVCLPACLPLRNDNSSAAARSLARSLPSSASCIPPPPNANPRKPLR
ncbi:hypothetical protein L249_6212 [Ophiocordyceps polyrhachis-furcata BCC 54312]|uniref:Uncharacterized protein n=1 Tax=Ophiocordyceps polyrhachis-furcata BCC 54312 TaxID=1330021 RepID=A0A367L105_9HYPO|nr:hypothetical protein L249_6212 [Ophiocordyceps polyrhachis-furcata BCC 54312]